MTTTLMDPPEVGTDPRPSGGTATATRRLPTTRWSRGHLLMVVAALAAVLGNLALLSGDAATRPALAVAGELTPGDVVTGDDVDVVTVGDGEALDGLARSTDEVVGLVVTSRVAEGELLRHSDVTAPVAGDANLRHLSLAVPAERAVGGRLRPDDRVDVISVGDEGARYLVTGVRVVAVGEPSGGLGTLTGHHVVVEVDADGALCLAAAVSDGEVDLVRTTGQAPATAEGCA